MVCGIYKLNKKKCAYESIQIQCKSSIKKGWRVHFRIQIKYKSSIKKGWRVHLD